ncbi:HECT-type ubiquitin ligase-interacting creD [Fusarium beomiforme]|uniref:HECT-type ubiquitin ligase-interacting creD n=1 Tax=Fusarium beomiforme TaxID=44412 RepID=A0A9P5ARE3_9HYPO|nr:HECT-type ubiquitin ligase-interacting creD [Fusarium beomiforme]
MSTKKSMRCLMARITGSHRPRLTIQPDYDYVFVSGTGDDAQGQYLRGNLSLFIPEGQSITNVQLKLTCRMWLGDHKVDTEDEVKWQRHENTVHQWEPFNVVDKVGVPFKTGKKFEWPFELFIRGDQEESFKGCTRCNITYLLEAWTVHHGSSGSFKTFAPIRIIRTPGRTSYELMDPATVQGKWSEKAEYNVSIRHRAIALGGLVPIEAQLTTISPTAKITKARFYLREKHDVENSSGAAGSLYEGQRVVTEWPLELKDEPQHRWQQCLHLPIAVRNCSPDFSVCGVSITHTLHFEVTVNKNGTITEEEISMPIHLFISPELPVNGWGVFVRDHAIAAKEVKNLLAEGIRVPPKYCKGDFVVEDYEVPPPAYSES